MYSPRQPSACYLPGELLPGEANLEGAATVVDHERPSHRQHHAGEDALCRALRPPARPARPAHLRRGAGSGARLDCKVWSLAYSSRATDTDQSSAAHRARGCLNTGEWNSPQAHTLALAGWQAGWRMHSTRALGTLLLASVLLQLRHCSALWGPSSTFPPSRKHCAGPLPCSVGMRAIVLLHDTLHQPTAGNTLMLRVGGGVDWLPQPHQHTPMAFYRSNTSTQTLTHTPHTALRWPGAQLNPHQEPADTSKRLVRWCGGAPPEMLPWTNDEALLLPGYTLPTVRRPPTRASHRQDACSLCAWATNALRLMRRRCMRCRSRRRRTTIQQP